ncbi:hypothetical protein [Nostoc sp.]|uniref:hypothetical protein n=1 Tax=Nostoc sp. TaxID=1180 RepID=UPI002FFC0322
MSVDTIALSADIIALSADTIALSVDTIIFPCYLLLRRRFICSVSHRYLQNAIAQVYNTTNDTGYSASRWVRYSFDLSFTGLTHRSWKNEPQRHREASALGGLRDLFAQRLR